MRVRVKICGITRIEDARAAIAAGADALGFVFARESPRFLAPDRAGRIIAELPPFVARVGVFVNSDEATVRRAIQESGVDTLQFHGDETPEFCRRFVPQAVYRAFRVRGPETLERLAAFPTSAWLLDSYVPGQAGGTGATFNWELAARAVALGRPVILAGGLTPDNVAAAIRQVQPWGVDVSSGVESGPGIKDGSKVRAFAAAAAGAAGGAELGLSHPDPCR
jgi:phosphoribosylanthranilate isomerase